MTAHVRELYVAVLGLKFKFDLSSKMPGDCVSFPTISFQGTNDVTLVVFSL